MPEMMVRGGQLYRLITDERGSLRLVVAVGGEKHGTVMQRADYDAWGNVTGYWDGGWAGGEPVPFGFAGGLYDRDTGLVRFGARDYDPQVGRWTNKDPLRFGGGDSNLYAYAGSDPVNGVDHNGQFPWANVAAAGAGALPGGGTSALWQYSLNPGHAVDWGDVWIAAGVGAASGMALYGTAGMPGAPWLIGGAAGLVQTLATDLYHGSWSTGRAYGCSVFFGALGGGIGGTVGRSTKVQFKTDGLVRDGGLGRALNQSAETDAVLQSIYSGAPRSASGAAIANSPADPGPNP